MNITIGRPLAANLGIASRLFAASVGIAATLAAPLSSLAQTVAASSAGLEEIVVTANKLNAQRVLDIPASVQAISGDALQNISASGIMSIAGEVPGLSIQAIEIPVPMSLDERLDRLAVPGDVD